MGKEKYFFIKSKFDSGNNILNLLNSPKKKKKGLRKEKKEVTPCTWVILIMKPERF